MPEIMVLNGREMDSPREIVDAFREYFATVYENKNQASVIELDSDEVSYFTSNICINYIDMDDVLNAIKSIKKGCRPGYYSSIYCKRLFKYYCFNIMLYLMFL
jgi:hypothetical protein